MSTVGVRSLLRREILRFVRRPRNTFLPPMITNLLYFVVFGLVLGGRIDLADAGLAALEMGPQATYITFILPGLVVLGTISNAFENASFSIFHGRWNEYIHEVLTSPLSHVEMVGAYVAASALRGIVVGLIIWVIGWLFLAGMLGEQLVIYHPYYLAAFSLVIPTLFAGFGVIGGLWARDFDYLTVLNQFIIRPLVFFGAVFYPLAALDGVAYTISLLNPMVYMVNGMRYGVVPSRDVVAIDPEPALAVLTGLTIVVLAVDVILVKRGYGLVE